MWKNQTLSEIINMVLDYQLGKSINALENFLLTRAHQHDMEHLIEIKEDYNRMAGYWRKGYKDPEYNKLYVQLLKRMYILTTNIMIHDRIRNTPFLLASYQTSRNSRKDWSLSVLKQDLEGFVSEVAMLSLEPEHVRKQKEIDVYKRHWEVMNDLVDYIWTSRLWKDSLADAFEEILLSPTVDSLDQQLILSAITLSAMNAFGFNKFKVLTSVYLKTTDERLRQRALVGWVFCADSDKACLFKEMQEIVAKICEDERCRKELLELQMQMFYCRQADNDTKMIKDEILPDIMKGNRLIKTRNGLAEVEEDDLQKILHPEAVEQDMEKMETSVRKMQDMQHEGSDIYFLGFSQMKRFPFFNYLSNWFVPFYPQHPGIWEIWSNAKSTKFLQILMKVGSFCDSDKYSFVIAFEKMLEQLPQGMLDMVERGEATPMPIGGEVSSEEWHQPAFIRRMYLQNMYRFFRLFPQRAEFVNPFEESYTFFSNPLFKGTELEQNFAEVGNFLIKRKYYEEAHQLLLNQSDEHHNFQYYMLMGRLMQLYPELELMSMFSSDDFFKLALKQDPTSEQAKAGVARGSFKNRDYAVALKYYKMLLESHPESKIYQLNVAICLTNLKVYEESLKYLFKLDYLYPEDDTVKRSLAWTLTCDGNYEKAIRYYSQLISSVEKPQPDDLLNYGLCMWLSGDVVNAVSLLRQYYNDGNGSELERVLKEEEHELLLQNGISEAEIQMMIDSVTSY